MGKGNRARLERAQNKLDQPQTYVAAKKQKPNWVNTAIVIFIAGILVLSLALSTLQNSGAMMRGANAIKSDNYTVSGTMVSYFFNSQYSAFLQTYGTVASYLGLDTSKPLKDQPCNMLEDGTWFDYFMNSTSSYVQELLNCCEYAKANGIALDDEDKADIDEAIEAMSEAAFENNYTTARYIAAMYGSGVKEKDIRAAMELTLLANKGAVAANDKFKAALTEESIVAYYDEHPEQFLSADYLVKEFEATLATIDEDDYADTAAYDAAVAEAEAAYEAEKAELLAKAKEYEAATGHQEFLEKLSADITAEYDGYYDDDASLTEAEREAKEKTQIATAMEAATVEGYVYQDPEDESSDELAKWLFAADRKVGDTYVIEDEDEEKGTYAVYAYCVTATVSREEYTTVDMAYAMFPASEGASSTAAAALKDKLVAANVTTAEAFEEAMKDQSTSGAATMENLLKDNFGYEAVDEYLYAEGRKAGDCEVINCGTEYIAVVLYLGEGDVAWHATAQNGALNEQMTAWYEEIATTYTVSVNEKTLNKIVR